MSDPKLPQALRKPNPTTIHGQTLHDDYAWMRDKSSPELLAHLAAENAYTASVMAPTEELQAKLYAGNAFAHQGNRRVRALPESRLALHHAHGRRPAVSHPLSPQGRCKTPVKKSCST